MYIATLEVECILSHHVDFPETMRSFSVSSMMLCTLHMWSHVNLITSVESIRYNIKVQVGEVIGLLRTIQEEMIKGGSKRKSF